MKIRFTFAFLSMVCFLFFSSCNSTTENSVEIRFSLPAAGARATENEPNYLYWLYFQDSEWKTEKSRIETENISIEVPIGSLAIFTLLYVPEDSGQPIETVGNIRFTEDLMALPVSDETERVVDLGILVDDESGFVSTVSTEALSVVLGCSTESLDALAYFDGTFTQFLNPDLDGNGKFDADENKSFNLEMVLDLPFNSSDLNYSGETADIDFTGKNKPMNCFMQIGLRGDFPVPEGADVKLILPADKSIYDSLGVRVTELELNNDEPETTSVGDEVIYGFSYRNSGNDITDPVPPINGDYILRLGDYMDIEFSDLFFLDFGAASQAGFLFPLPDYDTNAEGMMTELRWKWMVMTENGLRRATSDEIRYTAHRLELECSSGQFVLDDSMDSGAISSIDVESWNVPADQYFLFDYVTTGNMYMRCHFQNELQP